MDKTTKKFLIFLGIIFVLVTITIMFGGYSYQLKGLTKSNSNKPAQDVYTEVDMSSYSEAMHEKIGAKWTPPTIDNDASVVLEYTILKNGHIKDAKVHKSSGIKELDESAMTALRKASPLPPLPLNLKRDSITVKFEFAVKGRNK